MSFKTIVVHCDGGTASSGRLEIATDLAAQFDACLIGVHAKPPYEPPLFEKSALALTTLFKAYEEGAEAEKAAARAAYDKVLRGKSLKTEWHSLDGRVEDVMMVAARYADLVVVGQAELDSISILPARSPESVALSGGRPVLAVPHKGVEKAPGRTVLLCWNASRESARAATDALPFLKSAQKVIVLVVEPKVTREEPGSDVATWLARHGINVTVQRDVAPDADVGDVILSRAAYHEVDLMVMGLYGHSRLREMVLGGVSRTILSTMTVPVLMTH